jgi:hypothetical protein
MGRWGMQSSAHCCASSWSRGSCAINRDRRRPELTAAAHAAGPDCSFSADRLPVLEVARRAGVSRLAMWRWQQREAKVLTGCYAKGPERRTRCRCRPRLLAPVLALTCTDPLERGHA